MSERYASDLALELLEKFGRFECGMKAGGFFLPDRQRAWLDWKRFKKELGHRLTERPDGALTAAMSYLLEHPPEVQCIEEFLGKKRAVFRQCELEGESDGAKVLTAVCRVRNNLFHGGKHTDHSPEERNDELLRHSIAVLDAASELDEAVWTTYRNLA